jgi:hypothetical protein
MDNEGDLHLPGSGDTGDLFAETDPPGGFRITIIGRKSAGWTECVLERDRAEQLVAWLQSALAADRPSPP